MGIFDKIKSAIFGHEAKAATRPQAAAPAGTAAPAPAGGSTTPQVPGTAAAPSASTAAAPAAPTATASSPSPTPAGASAAPSATTSTTTPVDIAPILDDAAKKSGQKLDWRHSIVDLMKALGMDASLSERKELAEELGYDGDHNDSAKMNMWLHKALMKKLSENGGKVPADLMD